MITLAETHDRRAMDASRQFGLRPPDGYPRNHQSPSSWRSCVMKRALTTLAVAAAVAVAASAASAQTLNSIKSRGMVNCGANGTLGGVGLPHPQGNSTGLDVDFFPALAGAVFQDPAQDKIFP